MSNARRTGFFPAECTVGWDGIALPVTTVLKLLFMQIWQDRCIYTQPNRMWECAFDCSQKSEMSVEMHWKLLDTKSRVFNL